VDSLFYGLQTAKFTDDVLYVDPSAMGNKNGKTWNDAMHELPLALQIAGCGAADSLFVAEGAYLPNINNDRTLSFHIPDSTMVFGGFPLGGSAFGLRDPENYLTLLSGDIGVENDNSDNVYHVLKIDSAQVGIVLDGVTLSYGNAAGAGDDKLGPAVFCEGEASLQNVIATLNNGVVDVPMILNRGNDAYLYLRDCTITVPPNSKVLQIVSGQVTTQGNTTFVKE